MTSKNPYLIALEPDIGVARSWALVPPDVLPLWKMVVDIGVRHDPDDTGFSFDHVGALGLDRRSTMQRGVGEAVERSALLTPFDAPDLVSAVSLTDGSRVEIDRREVDYPGNAESGSYEATPSGAASGLSLEDATRAALIEQIERDAIQVAWCRQDGLRRIPDSTLSTLPTYATALDSAAKLGVTLTMARIPVACPGLTTAIAFAHDAESGIAAVGMKASDEPDRAVGGAAQESLQVVDALRAMTRSPAPARVTNDLERAHHFLQPEAAAQIVDWFEAAPLDDAVTLPATPVLTEELLAAVIADGGDPLRIDLTDRLPEAVRHVGWHAVKILVRGYQPLRMDETLDSTYVTTRIGALATTAPHPLI